MKKLWVYGASNCLPWRLDNPDQCWTNILACDIGATLVNRAQEGCDNLYIYHALCQDLRDQTPDDTVIVVWTHPNRKTWVLDRSNPKHLQEVDAGCLVYPGHPTFFRSKNKTNCSGLSQWLKFSPASSGNAFFDTWFSDYHSEYEQRRNLDAYIHSARSKISCQSFFMYFSLESINHVIDDPDLCYLEFVLDTRTWIDQDDLHCNPIGHARLASVINEKLAQVL